MIISNIRFVILFLGGVTTLASVSSVQAAEHYVLGVCQTATQSTGAEIRPTSAAGDYLVDYHGDDPRYKAKLNSGEFFSAAKVTLFKAPKHGKVGYSDNPKAVMWNLFDYMPNVGYIGRDNFVMQVEKDGVGVRIEYLIEGLDEDEPVTGICNSGEWKISAITPNQNVTNLQAFANAVDIRNTIQVVSLPHI
jgi:hypothetical protein